MSRPAMQRPVMDPTFLQELKAPPPRRPRRVWLTKAARVLRWIARKLLSNPFSFRRSRVKVERDRPAYRLARAVGYRLMFAPIVMAVITSVLVFSGTHPPRLAAAATTADPGSFDLYYAPVDFPSDDGVRLTGWLVPVIDARRVMLHKERILHQTYPAVVLAHDFGQSPHQMLPLIAPLHEDGAVVLAIGLRGTGLSRTAGQTFGLNEAGDVLAAVNLLRGRPFVDPDRIAVVGVGTGANAALLAAERDKKIKSFVLIDPIVSSSDIVSKRLGPDRFGLRWMQPLTKWTFEITYKHDIDEMNLSEHQVTLKSRPHLRLDAATTEGRILAATTDKVRKFCRESLR